MYISQAAVHDLPHRVNLLINDLVGLFPSRGGEMGRCDLELISGKLVINIHQHKRHEV